MPQKATKKQCSKGKGKNEDKVPEPSINSIGVRECLVWPRGGGDPQQPAQQQAADDSERDTKFIVKKGQLGKPVDRGYVYPEPTPRSPEDEGTVIEALRGWPGLAREAEECENGDNQDGGAQDAYISGCLKKGGSGKGKKGSGKKGSGCADDNGKGDPPMVYLVAHKYLSDFERKKMEEEEEERQKERAKRRPVDFAAMSEQKGNKTSKLRSIHLANQTPVDPKDLWKMKKFSNAKSHLDTFRKNEKNQKKGKKQSDQQAGGDDCTCGLNLNTYLNNSQPEPAGETQRYYDYDPVTTDRQEQQVDFYNYDNY